MSLPPDRVLIAYEDEKLGVGPEVLRKVTCENAARAYGFRM